MAAVAGLGVMAAPTASAAPADEPIHIGPIHRVPDDICDPWVDHPRTDFLSITSNSAPHRAVCFADWGTLGVKISQAVCVGPGRNRIHISFSDPGAAPINLDPGMDPTCWGYERTVTLVQIDGL
ncbi:hypothetical protein [Amycolatopsis pigmentata]|uniref:Uncharacterized protein n=1 Tax=Amycolatopsis pigmentata TaxID=450801 RepID=A0ABW5FU37_9PSEU